MGEYYIPEPSFLTPQRRGGDMMLPVVCPREQVEIIGKMEDPRDLGEVN